MPERERRFGSTAALAFGWRRTLDNLGPLVGIGLVSVLVSVAESGLSRSAERSSSTGGVVVIGLVASLLQQCCTMAYIHSALRINDDQPLDLSHLSEVLGGFIQYLFTMILYAVIVTAGIVLLVVPGVIFGLKFWFAPYVAVDKKVGPIEALRQSWHLTTGATGRLFGFILLMIGVNLLGALAIGVGLFVTVPMTFTASAYFMRRLQEQASARLAPRPVPSFSTTTPVATH